MMTFKSLCCITALLLLFNLSSCSTMSIQNTHSMDTHSPSNEYEGDGDSYWRSISSFKPIQDTAYGTITIKNSFYMQFDLLWHGLSNTTHNNRLYEGVFRIGTRSRNVTDCNGHATRYPALYLDRTLQSMQFSISDDIDCWGVGLLNVSYHLEPNTAYTVTIQYNSTWVMIQVNDRILHNAQRPGVTPPSMLSMAASIIISDSLDPPANVTLSNILIISYNSTLTMPPTPAPTPLPTVLTTTDIPDIVDPTLMATIKQDIIDTTSTENVVQRDAFFVEVIINAVYEETYEKHNETLNETVIERIVMNIFPSNITAVDADTTSTKKVIAVDVDTPQQNKEDVDTLIAYLQHNLSADLIGDVKKAYDWCDVVEVTYDVTVREIQIETNTDSRDMNTQHIPLDTETIIYIVIGVIIACVCSFALFVCILCGYWRLKKKMDHLEKERRNSSLSIGNEKVMDQANDVLQNDPIAEECQRLSHSLSGVQMSGSPEEISLEPHVIHSPEGVDKQSLYHRVSTNQAPVDDGASSSDGILDELTTANFSAKMNMSMTPSVDQMQHVQVPSNSHIIGHKLTIMIEDQMRITNQYANEEDTEYVPSMNSLTHDSHEAMYDEGFNGLIDVVNDTNTPYEDTSPTGQ
eukprot:436899_1